MGGQMAGWFTSKSDGKLHGFVATNIIKVAKEYSIHSEHLGELGWR
jgi:hypothetical protein